MYDLHDYLRMLADHTRVRAYVRALQSVVRPGSVVVDVGTGFGFFAVVACRLGAQKVYAIEPSEVIEVGRSLIEENGCGDRVELIQDDACRVHLPEQADVVLSDLRGGMPFATGNLSAVAHAREHFLIAGGSLVAASDTLMAAVAENEGVYARAVGSTEAEGVRMRGLVARLGNAVHRDRARSIQPDHLLTQGVSWGVVDYRRPTPDLFAGRASWTVARDGIGHGIVLWFDATLIEGVSFSTGPGLPGVYPQLFLPWPEPVTLRAGDRVVADIWVGANGQPWGWNSEITTAESGKRAHRFKQSTFLGDVLKSSEFWSPPGQPRSREGS